MQSDRSRWIALYVLCVGHADDRPRRQTIVNVALPSIQDDLGFSQSSLAWVVNAYLIAFGGLLLLAGRLGDLLGRRTIFLVGPRRLHARPRCSAALAQSQEMLVGARFVQGIGGAMTSAVILGMIVTMFPEPREQAKAIGVYGFVASAGGSIGLLAGGVLTQAISWHWIFFVNLPIGVVTALAGARGCSSATRASASARAPTSLGAVLITALADARRLHDRRAGRRGRLGRRHDARPRRRLARAAGGLRRPRGDRAQPADAAAHLPLAQRLAAPT